jgi:spore maturation protein CgeB
MVQASPRVLLYGHFAPQNFEFCWLEWLRQNSFSTQAMDQRTLLEKYMPLDIFFRVLWRYFQDGLVSFVSRQFVKRVVSFRPDLVIVVSGHLISSAALQTVRQRTGAVLFHFYGEDFFNPLNTNRTLRKSAPYYDHLFTTKSFNIKEMADVGIHHVSYLPHGYRPNCHYPVEPSPAEWDEYGSDLTFVGTWEAERAAILTQLTEFDLRIWGADWERAGMRREIQHSIQKRAVYCEEMSKVFNASRINLAFLRKANRDRHTSRTFEIPACGGFQLSERTGEILEFFEEGKEIECFDSVEELKDKANYYLHHEASRNLVASAGLARVRNSPYSYTDRLQTILAYFKKDTSRK